MNMLINFFVVFWVAEAVLSLWVLMYWVPVVGMEWAGDRALTEPQLQISYGW